MPFVSFKKFCLGNYLAGLLWTDQRIPGPVSCRCPGGLLETPPRWHATIYIQNGKICNVPKVGVQTGMKDFFTMPGTEGVYRAYSSWSGNSVHCVGGMRKRGGGLSALCISCQIQIQIQMIFWIGAAPCLHVTALEGLIPDSKPKKE